MYSAQQSEMIDVTVLYLISDQFNRLIQPLETGFYARKRLVKEYI